MSTENVRNFVHLFEECHTRIQTLGELLLISCKPRPVLTTTHDLELTNENFVRYRDRVISHLNKMCILSKDISSQIHTERLHVEKQLHQPLLSLSATIVSLTQLSAHIAYLMAINAEGSEPATQGHVSSHFELVKADLELKFVCARLKRSRVHDLNPHVLVDLCSVITKSLTCITDICKDAADTISDSNEQDQFKLCVKAITSTTGCLVSSIKSLKLWRQQQQHGGSSASLHTDHLQRVVNFCQPVTTTCTALTAFAMEDKFLGSPASLSPLGENIYKSCLGMCMSMVSASVQIIKAARDLLHDPTKRKHKDRISLCVESISRTAFRLRDFLLSYDFASKSTPSVTAVAVAASGQGEENQLAVIKDGEISTPFHAATRDKYEKQEEDGEKTVVSMLKRDKYKHTEDNMDKRQSASSSPTFIPTSASTSDGIGTPPSSNSSTKLLSSSPSSSPKLSSKSSSDSKKRHHRKSSSRHSTNASPIVSQSASPQHNASSTATSFTPLSNETSSPQLSPGSSSILPLPLLATVAPLSLSVPPPPPPSSSTTSPSSSSSPPISAPTSSSSLLSLSSSSSPPIRESISLSSHDALDTTTRNMREEFVLSMDVPGDVKSERL